MKYRIFLFFNVIMVGALIFSVSGCVSILKGEWGPPENPSIQTYPQKEAIWSEFVQTYYPSWANHYWVDRDLWGNRGYIYGGPPIEELSIAEEKSDLTSQKVVEENLVGEEKPVMSDTQLELLELKTIAPPSLDEINMVYVVVKDDTLWDIAANPNVYSDPLKWPMIYNANRDVITDPDLIFPEQQLIIPR